jgi:hypothetical protein
MTDGGLWHMAPLDDRRRGKTSYRFVCPGVAVSSDDVDVVMRNGQWVATQTEGGVTWTAESDNRVGVVLALLAARLGLPSGADRPDYRWERYARTCAPDHQLDGLGDLCAFLGGSWSESEGSSSFTAGVLRLIAKAQATPKRFMALEGAFPREVTAWRVWSTMSPTPAARELCAVLVALTGEDKTDD